MAAAFLPRYRRRVTSSSSRPRLRGVIHHYSFFLSLLSGVVLVALAQNRQAVVGTGIYAFSVSALLGTSALYHRVTWSPAMRRWIGRLDHSMISVLIAGALWGLVKLRG